MREGQVFLERALAASKTGNTAIRAKALTAAAELAFYLDDMERMEAHCRESLSLFEELGDTEGIAKAHYLHGTAAWWRSRFVEAHSQLAEALSLFHRAGDKWGEANTLVRLGRAILDQGKYEEARTWFEQGLALFRALDDQQRIAYVLAFLARTLFVSQEDISRARALTEESQGLLSQLDHVQGSAYVSCLLAEILVDGQWLSPVLNWERKHLLKPCKRGEACHWNRSLLSTMHRPEGNQLSWKARDWPGLCVMEASVGRCRQGNNAQIPLAVVSDRRKYAVPYLLLSRESHNVLPSVRKSRQLTEGHPGRIGVGRLPSCAPNLTLSKAITEKELQASIWEIGYSQLVVNVS